MRGYREGENPARWRGHLASCCRRDLRCAKSSIIPPYLIPNYRRFTGRVARSGRHRGSRARIHDPHGGAHGRSDRSDVGRIELAEKVWTCRRADEGRPRTSGAAVSARARYPRGNAAGSEWRACQDSCSPAQAGPAAKQHGISDAVAPHGPRRPNGAWLPLEFRDWAAERTNFPSEVAEMALAHAVGDKVEAAYRRGDLFEKRRRLTQQWATFCTTAPTDDTKTRSFRCGLLDTIDSRRLG